jgi:hypothetical protein
MMMSRGVQGFGEGIRDCKTICFTYAIKDTSISHPKDAERFRGAFESVTGSRVSAGGKGSGLWESGLSRNTPPIRRSVEENPESVVAHVEQELEG